MSTEFYNRNWRMPNSFNGSTDNNSKSSNYSMSFDGSSEYIDIGNPTELQLTNNISVSGWFKTSSTSVMNMFTKRASGINNWAVYMQSGKIYFWVSVDGSSVPVQVISATTLNDGNWHFFAGVREGTSLKLYIDNLTAVTGTIASGSLTNPNGTVMIGKAAVNSFLFNGELDHFAVFDYALSASQITSLYGSSSTGVGNPMALSTKPVAYYKIGDKAAFNGSEYLVTNAASEVYSPYALDFDGTNDYIQGGNIGISGNATFSISYWAYWDGSSFSSDFPSVVGNSTFSILKGLSTTWKNGRPALDFWIVRYIADNALLTRRWYHLAFTKTQGAISTTSKIYVNGLEVNGSIQGQDANPNITNSNLTIGRLNNQSARYWNGKLSNISIWNAALTSTQVLELYGSGTPTNLNNHSAYSNLVSWWQLGKNMSYDGTKWIVLDEKSSNNGEGTNLGPAEDSIVNGVGTSGNGLSDGMGGADNIIGDAPYSTVNAVSYGMGVDALSTDVPS